MSHELTIQLSDALYEQLQSHAVLESKSPGELVIAAIAQQYPSKTKSNSPADSPAPPKSTKKESARGLVRKHFGTFDLGRPVGTDNEAIDADLAREYADNHENS